MAVAFSEAQDRWSERLMAEEKFSDAVAILGSEGRRVPFIRALLASLSEPLCAALYGEFKENSTREIVLMDVSEDAFDVMRRSAHHLDPKLTPERAIAALKAAKLYLIDDLSSYCLSYLQELVPSGWAMRKVQIDETFRAMTAALKMSQPLPKDVLKSYFGAMLENPTDAMNTPAFLQCHGCIIHELIQSDVLEVEEELLWDRLLEWTEYAVQRPEILGPFAEATGSTTKRAKLDREQEGLGEHERQQQGEIMRMMAQHLRFPAMSKEFFFDNVRSWLSREHLESLLHCVWMGHYAAEARKSRRAVVEREVALVDPDLKVRQNFPRARGTVDSAQTLLTGSTWTPPHPGSCLEVTLPQRANLADLSKVELTFSQQGFFWKSRLSFVVDEDENDEVELSCVEGQKQVFEGAFLSKVFRIRPAEVLKRNARGAAPVTKVTVFAKQNRLGVFSQEADRLASKMLEINSSP